jgi:predicted acylesterase/phospholipase RssA
MTASHRQRHPVRASLAFAGAGALGTFLSGAAKQLIIALRNHNRAVAEGAADSDPRYLGAHWGRITVDSIGGASAGAICGAQVIKALFDPRYLGEGLDDDAPSTITGDWINEGDFVVLAGEGTVAHRTPHMDSPGWSLLSGARLQALVEKLLSGSATAAEPDGLVEDSGIVAFGVTLTDLFGVHSRADFDADRVLGHPDFGQAAVMPRHGSTAHGPRLVRDLGGRNHAEVRKFLFARDAASREVAARFLADTGRSDAAEALVWQTSEAAKVAAVCAASAALPFAIGPVAIDDARGERRLYIDGGVLNNKPVAPALRLGRWQDAIRLQLQQRELDGTFSAAAVGAALNYERAVFFVDAFPDQTPARARHGQDAAEPAVDPVRFAEALLKAPTARVPTVTRPALAVGSRTVQLQAMIAGLTEAPLMEARGQSREEQMEASLLHPTAASRLFFDSLMNSVRAQDMREIAKRNNLVAARAQFITDRCERPPVHHESFRVDSLGAAQAYASVLGIPASEGLTEQQRLAVAERVWESDQVSGLGGRRMVSLVPVFSPDERYDLFAGDRIYAVGGLLSLQARMHDAGIGGQVAHAVTDALSGKVVAFDALGIRKADESQRPQDAELLMRRIRASGSALVDSFFERHPIVAWFAKLPIYLDPIMRIAKRSLDRQVSAPRLPPDEN